MMRTRDRLIENRQSSVQESSPPSNAFSSTQVRFNFGMGLAHGILFQAGLAFSSPTTILPVFLKNYTGSLALIGLFSAVVTAGGVFPQLLVAHRLKGRPTSKPVLVGAIWTRAAAWGLLGLFTWLCADCTATVLLVAVFVLLLIFSVAGGVANVPFAELWGKTLPVRLRGRFWGHRQLWGGLLAMASGYIVKLVLGAPISFPRNYALLFLFSFLLLVLSYVALSSVREPEGEREARKETFVNFLSATLSQLHRDRGLTWLMITQLCTRFFMFAAPFYVLYGRDRLEMPTEEVGVLVTAQMSGAIISNLLWGWLSDTYGNRSVIRLTAATTIAIPLLALIASHETWWLLLGVFVLIGAAISGSGVGFINYVLEVAEPRMRPAYIALSGTLNGLLSLLPVIGGWIIDIGSYELAFALALGFGLLALPFSLKLRCLRP